MRAHERSVARVRLVHRLASRLFLGSYRVRTALARGLGGWRGYVERDGPFSVSDAGPPWTPGRRRALLVTHDLSASGGPRLLAEIASILSDAGWRVTVLSPEDGPARGEFTRRNAAVVVDPTVLSSDSPLLTRLARRSEFALCNTVVTADAVRALSALVPTLWYLHEVSLLEDMIDRDAGAGAGAVGALRAAERVFAGSELSASIARRHRPDVRVLPYGVDPIPTPPGSAAEGASPAVRLAVFGSVEPRKGQDLAVGALAALDDAERDSVRLSLFGRVLDRPFADGVRAVSGFLPEVAWGGELDAEAYRAAMIATDAVLVSSRDDTLPLVSLDALGAGKVLMCTPTTGTSAWLRDGENGFVAEAATADAIAAMLARALARRADWPTIAREGRVLFADAFSKDAFAARILAEADAASSGVASGK